MTGQDAALIVYDGECIFCQNYVRLRRLKQTLGAVELLDARSDDPRLPALWAQGYDLHEGMLFIHGGQIHHGAEAVNILARLSSPVGWFNRLNRAALGHTLAARLIYPLLKIGRGATLAARGKSRLRG